MKRRSFFGTAAASAGVLTGGALKPSTAKAQTKLGQLLKIGIVTCHPSHHHMPNIWGPLIQCVGLNNNKQLTRMTGMILTQIWDKDPGRVESYCATFGTKPAKSYDSMVGDVDGVIISDMRNASYFPELTEPYLKAGIPVLFNRPFTPNLGACKRIIASSKKHGTPFMTASGWEYCKEVYAMRNRIDKHGPVIKAVSATNSSTEITHDVHGVWIICAMVGTGIESVAVARGVKSVHEHGSDVWTIYYGAKDNRPGFYATLHNQTNRESNASVRVQFENSSFEQALWYLSGGTEQRYQYYFLPPLLEFQRMIVDGKMPQSHEQILEKTAVFLAGFKSHLKYDGKPVRLDELEDDFEVQSDANTISYPDGYFG